MSTDIIAADVGGTHARFAIATVADGRVVSHSPPVKFKTQDHSSFQLAVRAFAATLDRDLPPALGLSFAGPVDGEILKLTNNPWIIRPALMKEKLGVERFAIVNDFGAVAHAVAQFGPEQFSHICGPDRPLPEEGVISIVGPGTGLGVAQLLRRDGHYHAIETEGGHIDYAPLDGLEDQIVHFLRATFRRVSVERICAGMGIGNLYRALAHVEGVPVDIDDDKELWARAFAGTDPIAGAALDRYLLALGSVAGDIALAHGAKAVVLGGGLGLRLKQHLPQSGFARRFIEKGRFERRMADIPVKLITCPEPGIYGAAAAFASKFGE